MIPAEAVLVSLAGKPSAKQSRLIAMQRLEGATDEVVASIERGDAVLPAPAGQVCREIQFQLRTTEVRRGDEKDKPRRIIKALAYNRGFDPEPGQKFTREELRERLDSHGTFMRSEDIEACAHRFMRISRGIDKNHDMIPGAAVPVESFFVRSADGEGWSHPEGVWPEGAWVLASEVDSDETWEQCQRGIADPNAEDVITGYSVYIYAHEEEVEVELVDADPADRTAPADPVVEQPPAPAPAARTEPEPEEEPAPGSEDDPEPEEKPAKRTILQALRGLFTMLRSDGYDLPEFPEESEADPQTREEPWSDFSIVWPLISADAQFGELFWALRVVVDNVCYDSSITDKPAWIAKAFDAAKATAIHLHTQMEGVRGQLRTEGGAPAPPAPRETETDPLGINAALRALHATNQIDDTRLKTLREAASSLHDALASARGEDDDVTEEQVRALLGEFVSPIQASVAGLEARLDAAEKARNAPPEPTTDNPEPTPGNEPAAREEETLSLQAMRSMLEEQLGPIQRAVSDITERTERLEGTAPAPSQARSAPNDNNANPKGRVQEDDLVALYGSVQ